MRTSRPVSLLLLLAAGIPAVGNCARPLAVDDWYALARVSDAHLSPDGRRIAYTVTSADRDEDVETSDVWTVSWDGRDHRRLTSSPAVESSPRWSPDGRYLSFLSDRDDDGTDQLWLLDLAGGEAERLTDLDGGVSDYAWSPDGRRLVLVSEVGRPSEDEDHPQPIVVNRLQFKADERGYLGTERTHLFLLDVASGVVSGLTDGPYNEEYPAWSPDGRSLVFVTKRARDPDASDEWGIYRIEARAGATPVPLKVRPGKNGDPDGEWSSGPPDWSPDGKRIAYVHRGPTELLWYALNQVAIVPAAGEDPGAGDLPTAALDRLTLSPRWSPDGQSIYFRLEDDRNEVLARVRLRDGRVERLTAPGSAVSEYDIGRGGRVVLVSSSSDRPAEIFALEGGSLRQLTSHNAGLLGEVRLAKAQDTSFASRDGLEIHGMLLLPPLAGSKAPYAAWLDLHGGPVAQHQHEFDFEAQLLAANGYAVILPNPRGSSGRGLEFQRRLFARWGEVDVPDVLAAADHVVAAGVADPQRLVIGGWSYGAILTNYVIASDRRFKAAISGAGMGNMLGGYGIDEYVREWELELGPPWQNTAKWVELSGPFLHADRISTPTLFMCGDQDFNVPLPASEQMYQALRSLGVPTELVIYPGEFHTLYRPSFQIDSWRRYIEWYERWLRPAKTQ